LLANNCAPGTDGLPGDFYTVVGPKIMNINVAYDSINYGILTGHMSIENRSSALFFIPKKNKYVRKLKKWRLLALLNCD
jgi:hypothetical protein